jgi:hypothetical protein
VFTQEDWLTAKYRCRQHAGCEPPEDVLEVAPEAPRLVVPSFTRVDVMANDWARKAANDRDE